MSGTSYGTVVLHVAPEAAVGGPLALVRDGDTIVLDVPARRLDLEVDDAELERRRAEWAAPEVPEHRSRLPAPVRRARDRRGRGRRLRLPARQQRIRRAAARVLTVPVLVVGATGILRPAAVTLRAGGDTVLAARAHVAGDLDELAAERTRTSSPLAGRLDRPANVRRGADRPPGRPRRSSTAPARRTRRCSAIAARVSRHRRARPHQLPPPRRTRSRPSRDRAGAHLQLGWTGRPARWHTPDEISARRARRAPHRRRRRPRTRAPLGRAPGLMRNAGAVPHSTWIAPGRVNLIGEHTDYNGGFVLPFALPLGVTAAATPRADRTLRLTQHQQARPGRGRPSTVWRPARSTGGRRTPRASPGPCRRGLRAERRRRAPRQRPAHRRGALVLRSARVRDRRRADRRGGSAARPRPAHVRLCHRAENDFVGVPSGILDQSASVLCRAGHALFLDARSLETRQVPLPLDEHGLAILVIDTRAHHTLADGEYGARRRECEQAAQALGVDHAARRDPRSGRRARRRPAAPSRPAHRHRERARAARRRAARVRRRPARDRRGAERRPTCRCGTTSRSRARNSTSRSTPRSPPARTARG